MGELSKLPNIGKAVEEQLIQVGIETPEALRQVGAKAVWLKIQEIDPSACIHRKQARSKYGAKRAKAASK